MRKWIEFVSLLCGVFVLAILVIVCTIKINQSMQHDRTRRYEFVDTCVKDACLAAGLAEKDRQHRVFSDLRKALECDQGMAAAQIIQFGKDLDSFDEYPFPKPLTSWKGLPMPDDVVIVNAFPDFSKE